MNTPVRHTFAQGFRAVLPLWLAAAPVALAYVLAAQHAGLAPIMIQGMSLLLASSAVQLALVGLIIQDAQFIPIVITALLLNLHQLFYGLALVRQLRLTWLERILAASFMTDAAYAVTTAAGERASLAFLMGAETSIYLAWNLFTALALLLGQVVAMPASAQLSFAAPLTFFALLLTLLKRRSDVVAALCAALIAGIGHLAQIGALTLLITGIGGALLAAWLIPAENAA